MKRLRDYRASSAHASPATRTTLATRRNLVGATIFALLLALHLLISGLLWRPWGF